MMFRSLFVAPLLVAADVEEQSVLLQMKGRAETQVMMQRASDSIGAETLRNLEMGLMAKGGPKKVETAKCAYHMKTAKEEFGGQTPCFMIDVLEEVFEESLDHFGDFAKIGEGAVKEIMKVVDTSLKNYPDVNLTHTFEMNATNLNLKDTKFHKAFTKGLDKKLGSEMNETTIYENLNDHGIFAEAEEAFDHLIEVQDDVLSLMKGGDLLSDLSSLGENFTFNVSAMQEAAADKKAHGEVKKMIETYANAKKNLFLDQVGAAFASFWEETIGYAGDEDPLDIDWSDKKEVSKAHKKFWLLASSFADDANVESICKSDEFNEKTPMLKKVCKGSSKPKCLDEFMYLHEDTDGTDGICEVASAMPRKIRGKKFSDSKFMDYCNSTNDEGNETTGAECESYFVDVEQPWVQCKKANDVRKACSQLVKFNKAQIRKAEKAKKKAFYADKKACFKECKSKPRKERKDCKKDCKTEFHKDNLANYTIPEPEVEVVAQ